jgi:thiopeptide-type bacteriocin biosynthesis protein
MKAARSQPAPARESAIAKVEPLYQPLDFVTVRAPLLPVECYRDLADEKRQSELVADPRVLAALAVGSTSLLGAVERFNRSGLTPRDADRMRAKLRRYQIRMATRPTPYGLFAGVALAQWGETTDLRVSATSARTGTRPDMAWLMSLVLSAEADPAIRRHLSFVANPSAVVEAGRLFLAERAPSSRGNPSTPVSIRATGVVKRVLALARSPISYEDLAARLCQATPSATMEKVEKLLTELWEQTVLLTDLRPPLTSGSPARYVAERLADIPAAAGTWAKLNSFVSALSTWDSLPAGERTAGFKSLLAETGVPLDGSQQVPVQVDMAMSLQGRIGNIVAREAAQTAELLLRLSPYPRGLASLAGYRQMFVNRYGYGREVPLKELLDPQRGLGAPSFHGHGATGPDPAKAGQRAQALMQLATTALHRRERTVLLDEALIARLETWRPSSDNAPLSLDINVLIGARSAAAIDRGEFTMVLGPNLGAQSAGRNLGRFAGLLAPDGPEALAQVSAAEQAHAPDRLWAEAVYLPANFRLANVVIRPAVRTYEVAVGVTPGVPFSRVIPLDELVVGVEQGRFYVRWPAAGKRVSFSAGHMLNTHNAPAVVRFLSDLASDGKAVLSAFDWGPAESFPYLPRVQAGRIALRPAEWRIPKGEIAVDSPAAFRSSLDRWRAEWDVPQLVSLTVGDNRLILSLDQDVEAAELKAEIQKLGDFQSVILQEVLPTLEEAWLQGEEGHYYSELIVSLILRPGTKAAATADAANAAPARTSREAMPEEPEPAAAARPGAESPAQPEPQSAAESGAESVAALPSGPVVQSAPKPGSETTAQPAAESAAASPAQSAPKPGSETAAQPAAESAAASPAQSAPKPGSETAAKPAAESAAPSPAQSAPKPGSETAAKPAAESAAASAAQSAPKPGSETAAKPAAESAAASPAQSAPKPGSETAAQPAAESAAASAAQSAPKPGSETAAQPAAESAAASPAKPGPPSAAPSPAPSPAPTAAQPPAAFAVKPAPVSRLRPPGSEWLFVKLYCPRNIENDVIPESMLTFAENVVAAGLADSWFFIRYSDPDSHIRLRFHGSPQQLTGRLFANLCDWAGGLMAEGLCLRFAFDTYDQEIERFGGAAGMAAAEALFSADSRASARLLHELKRKLWPHDELTLLALGIDDLLGAMGFEEADRLRWYSGQTNARAAEIGAEFRQRKNVLRPVLGEARQFLAGLPGGSAISAILAQRREALAPVAARLRSLAAQQVLSQPLDALCASFVHLHLNRMASAGAPSEQRILSLLLRTRESLAKAPVGAAG